jgi:hypothetical protein
VTLRCLIYNLIFSWTTLMGHMKFRFKALMAFAFDWTSDPIKCINIKFWHETHERNSLQGKLLGRYRTKCSGVYIGESSRQLDKRLYEHRNDYKNRLKSGKKTALIKHANNYGHTFDFDNSEILNFETNWYKRRYLESSQIQLYKPKML